MKSAESIEGKSLAGNVAKSAWNFKALISIWLSIRQKFSFVSSGIDLTKSASFLADTVTSPSFLTSTPSIVVIYSISKSVAVIFIEFSKSRFYIDILIKIC